MTDLRLTKRQLLGGAAGLSAGFLSHGADAATNFNVGTFGGPYEKVLRESVLPKFDHDHNVTTKLELGIGVVFLQKLLASRKRPPYNVFVLNEDEALVGDDAGLFADLDLKRLPNLSQIYPALQPPAVKMYGTMLFELNCVYNADRMAAPKSWADLWQKGLKVGVASPQNPYGLLFLMVAAEMNGGSANNLGPGFAQIKKLENMKIYKGVVDGIQLFRTGEIDVGFFYRNRAVELADEGKPIKFCRPKEGSFGHRSGIQVPKNATQLDVCYDWISMCLTPMDQALFASHYYSPSNKTLVLPPELAAKHIYGQANVDALRFPDWKVLNAQKSDVYERWEKEFTQ